MTDIWDKLWEDINWDRVTTIPFITERIKKIKAEGDKLKEKVEKLGDISAYPEIKFGHMTVLDYLDLVELQADTYTERALVAEQTLRTVKEAFAIHYSTLHDCAWMDSKKMLKTLDETAEEVKNLLKDQCSGENSG